MTKTTFLQKIGLFFFAVFVTLLLLEGALRLGGFFFLFLQDKVNRQSLSSSQEFRILCLGESTTALGGQNAYPRQLEQILNSSPTNHKFKVINKGVPATTTDQIISKVESYLDEYRPQMVVAMMGINDPQDLAKRSWRENLSRYSKAFKLLDMIQAHWSAKHKENTSDFVDRQIAKLDRQAAMTPSLRMAVELTKANLYRSANRPEDEKKAILKVLSLNDKNPQGWHLLGIYYQRHAEYTQALDALEKAYQYGTADIKLSALERMAEAYKFLNQYDKAQKIYSEILVQQPQHPQARSALGDIMLEQGKYEKAIELYTQQLSLEAHALDVYGKLAHCYRRTNQPLKANEIFESGAKINKDAPELFYEWGYSLLEDKKYLDAENAFNQALQSNKKNERQVNAQIYEQLLKCYQAENKTAQELEVKNLMQQTANQYNPLTQKNYLKLKQILDKRHIELIVVQYPLRSVIPLKAMLSSFDGVVIIDNEQTFKDALKKFRYDDLFSDRFAGDFGHCTAQGNALLAGHLAQAILKAVSR